MQSKQRRSRADAIVKGRVPASMRESVVEAIRKVSRGAPTMTVLQAGSLLGLTKDGSYDAARRGTLPVIRIGERSMRVSVAVLERILLGEEP